MNKIDRIKISEIKFTKCSIKEADCSDSLLIFLNKRAEFFVKNFGILNKNNFETIFQKFYILLIE